MVKVRMVLVPKGDRKCSALWDLDSL